MAAMQDAGEARSRLMALIYGYRSTAVLHVAAIIGLADLLHGRARDSEELARETGTHTPSLLRLLRGLAVLGVVDEVVPGRFQLSGLGEPLLTDAPQSLRGQAARFGDEDGMRTWGNLLHTIRTGATTFDHIHGMSGFEFFANKAEVSAGFNRAMVEGTRAAMPAILAAYDFSRFGKIADIGGGSGALIAAILQAHAGARGVLFDRPSGADWAPRLLEKAGVADRCEIVEGDFFKDPLPRDCGGYVQKSVIRDWDDDRALAILRSCRKAGGDSGMLIVIEPVMPEKVGVKDPDFAIVSSDLNMLVNTGGRERTEAEFGELFASADFRLTNMIPTNAPYPLSVMDGVPV